MFLLRLLWTIKYIIEQFSGNIFVLAELPKSCLIKFVDMFFSDLVSKQCLLLVFIDHGCIDCINIQQNVVKFHHLIYDFTTNFDADHWPCSFYSSDWILILRSLINNQMMTCSCQNVPNVPRNKFLYFCIKTLQFAILYTCVAGNKKW